MTDLKSLAESERNRRLAWGRVKQALLQFLIAGKHVGTERSQNEEAQVVRDFIRRIEEIDAPHL